MAGGVSTVDRSEMKSSNPEMTFGEISAKMGEQWRALPMEEKAVFMEKAAQVLHR